MRAVGFVVGALVALLAGLAIAASLPQSLPGCSNYALSRVGDDDSSIETQAYAPAVSYASDAKRYLTVYHADVDPAAFEIYAKVTDAFGTPITPTIRVSRVGTSDADADYDAFFARAAYSTKSQLWLVVFQADQQGFNNAFEVYGQLVDKNGVLVGPSTFRISHVGAVDTDAGSQAGLPDVAYNSDDDEFLVVFISDEHAINNPCFRQYPPVQNCNSKVHGQIVKPNSVLKGNAFRISYQGPDDIIDSPVFYDVLSPRVVYGKEQYMVTFGGDYAAGGGHVWEAYITVVKRDGTLATPGESQRISHMGAKDSDAGSRAFDPVLAFNPDRNEYLLAWYGDETDTGATGALDVYAQLLTAAGAPIGPPQFQVTRYGADPRDTIYDGTNVRVGYDVFVKQYYACFTGDEDGRNNAFEIFCVRISPAGLVVDQTPARISYSTGEARDKFLPAGHCDIVGAVPGRLFVVFEYTEYPPDDRIGGQDGALDIWGAQVDTSLNVLTGDWCEAQSSSKKKADAGTVAGAVIGALIGCALLSALAVFIAFCVRRSRRRKGAVEARKASAGVAMTDADAEGKDGMRKGSESEWDDNSSDGGRTRGRRDRRSDKMPDKMSDRMPDKMDSKTEARMEDKGSMDDGWRRKAMDDEALAGVRKPPSRAPGAADRSFDRMSEQRSGQRRDSGRDSGRERQRAHDDADHGSAWGTSSDDGAPARQSDRHSDWRAERSVDRSAPLSARFA